MKTLFTRLAAVALVAMLFSFPARAADSPSVLLQKGIYAEETEGNVDAAIKIYEQIAAEAATSRAVVAQAQYRLAVCYQKKGNKEQAINLLKDLVKQFPSELALTEKAREILTQMGEPIPGALKLRELPRLELSWVSTISPDGRFVGFMPKDSPDISIYETATGKTWKIATCEPAERVHDKFYPVGDGRISPDGKLMAYTRVYEDASKERELWIANVDGSGTRKVYGHERKGLWTLWPLSWSPDSTQVIMVLWEEKSPTYEAIVALNAKTGETKEMKRVSTPGGVGFDLSWNGQLLALLRNGGDHHGWLALADLKSDREVTLVDRDVYGLVGWSPADASYVYLSNRTGEFEIWAIGVEDGKPSGPSHFLGKLPELINYTKDELTFLGVSRGGNAYVFLDDKNVPWMAEGLLATKVAPAPVPASTAKPIELPLSEFAGPNHSIWDRNFGLSLTLPADWIFARAGRFGVEQNFVGFVAPAAPDAWLQVYYISNPDPKKTAKDDPRDVVRRVNVEMPKPTTTSEVDAWLRKCAQYKAESRLNKERYANYKTRPDSTVSRTVGGRRALSWLADYTKDGKAFAEYVTIIYSENVFVQPFLQAPAEQIESVRPAFDLLIETIRSP